MESVLPGEVLSEIEHSRRRSRRARTRHLVVAGAREHRIVELSDDGFVIEADGLPHLRGYVDIMLGEERIARRLVVFAWARDGLVGYDFKLGAIRHFAPADYVRPERIALIGAPKR
jgi:hypothetical protein